MKNTRRIVAAVFAAFLVIMPLLASCENQTDDGRPTIAVSILPEATFVRAVAGELAEHHALSRRDTALKTTSRRLPT